MKTDIIHYLSSKDKESIIERLQFYYNKEGIVFRPYFSEDSLKDVQYLLLIEPFEENSEYYAVSKLWKSWLIKNAPHIHLLVATFASCRHSNFLNLADLPISFKEKLKTTIAVKEFIPEYSHTVNKNSIKEPIFTDPWNIYLPLSGQDINKIMERFIRGHDRTNSYFEQLIRIRKRMYDLEYWQEKLANQDKKDIKLIDKIEQHYTDIQKEWDYLLNRWHQYKDLMSFLPFNAPAILIDSQMKELEALIDSDDWDDKKAKPSIQPIEIIRKELKHNFLPYIYAEQYW